MSLSLRTIDNRIGEVELDLALAYRKSRTSQGMSDCAALINFLDWLKAKRDVLAARAAKARHDSQFVPARVDHAPVNSGGVRRRRDASRGRAG